MTWEGRGVHQKGHCGTRRKDGIVLSSTAIFTTDHSSDNKLRLTKRPSGLTKHHAYWMYKSNQSQSRKQKTTTERGKEKPNKLKCCHSRCLCTAPMAAKSIPAFLWFLFVLFKEKGFLKLTIKNILLRVQPLQLSLPPDRKTGLTFDLTRG